MKPNEPAFPVDGGEVFEGMTKREYIAAKMLAAIVGSWGGYEPRVVVAADAVAYADALIAELAKGEK